VRASLAGGLVNSLVIDEVGARALLGEGDSRERR
jgi:DNA-binding transcriptional regulator LsrR (DeoR family)